MIAELMPDPGLVGMLVYLFAAGVFVGAVILAKHTDNTGK